MTATAKAVAREIIHRLHASRHPLGKSVADRAVKSARVAQHQARRLEGLVRRVRRSEARVKRSRGISLVDALLDRPPIAIVIPIYNASASLERCLDSVRRHTTLPHSLVLVDDASTDPAIGSILAGFEGRPGVTVLRSAVNRGFTASVNRAIAVTGEDIVLLNSDTIVPPAWLQGLMRTAHAAPDIATVTPLSDNAGAFSAPIVGKANDPPAGLDPAAIGRLVRQAPSPLHPEAPTGHGFCMYVKRRALDEVGTFDEGRFPRGYGEENDFCMRASAAGWRHVVDDATYVLHERSASFGEEKEALLAAGRSALDATWPSYTSAARRFVHGEEMTMVRARVARAFAEVHVSAPPPRPRLLFVLHDGSGGTPATNLDLMRALEDGYDCFTLTAISAALRLDQLVAGDLRHVSTHPLPRPWSVEQTSSTEYRATVTRILCDQAIELVHIRHLLGHTLDLPEVARALGVPVVLSFHDFYLSCPTVHLLDDSDRFCGGRCTPGHGTCRMSSQRTGSVPHLKHAWVHEWRSHVREMLAHVDACVTTSQSARAVMERSLPSLKDKPFHVFEHGREPLPPTSSAVSPVAGAPLRILFIGNIGVHKGSRLIRALDALDIDGRLDLHFLGALEPELMGIGTDHGTYERSALPGLITEIAPSFIGVFSIWPETYSHTLTEAWQSGVPVLASDIGVLRERLLDGGGGWLVDHTDVQRLYGQIIGAAADPTAYEEQRQLAIRRQHRSLEEMARDYDSLYRTLVSTDRLA